MNRFKDLCVSDSSSDDEEETQQTFQRGRVRENKRFVEGTPINTKEDKPSLQQKDKQQLTPQQQQHRTHPNTPPPNGIYIQVNQHRSNTSLNMSEKFIRQQVKPVQQQMKHYLQKMRSIIQERKKFINALTAAGRDLGKVEKRIDELKTSQRNGDNRVIRCNNVKIKKGQQQKQFATSNNVNSWQPNNSVQLMQKLKHKITLHISNLMTEHHKTVQLLSLARKQIDKYFQKVKFSFLDTNIISLYQSQCQAYVEYGIPQLYSIIEQADSIINEHTAFFSTVK